MAGKTPSKADVARKRTTSLLFLRVVDEPLVVSARDALRSRTTFQPADIHKMHAYKDALGARRGQERQEVRSVWVLYPGDATAFFSETAGRVSAVPGRRDDMIGVGALPMQPGREAVELRRALRSMIAES